MNHHLTSPRDANCILAESFLDARAKLLEVAAVLDRIDRAAEDVGTLNHSSQACRTKVDEAIRILLSEGPDRAARLQRLFSREYDAGWRSRMQL